jgi:hypothetical protein
MPKKVRRRIFYGLIALFLVLGAGAVLYAQGWRLVPRNDGGLALGKVGAIYVRTFPAETTITLDGKPRKKSAGFFDRGTLLTNLLPDRYELGVDAQGFQPWRLQTSVTSSLVTSLRYVVLVPTGATAATSTPVRDIGLAGRTLVLDTAAGMTTLTGAPIAGTNILAGAEDGSIVLTYATSTRNYLAVDLSRATTTALGRLGETSAARTPGLSFQPVPGDNGLFLAQSSTSIGLLNVREGGIVRLATTTADAAGAAAGRVAWAEFDPDTRMSLLSFYDIAARRLDAEADSLPGRITQIIPRNDNTMLARADDGSLYLVNTAQSNRTRLARGARLVALADDGNSLAALGENGVEVFFLRGERANLRFDIPDADLAQGLAWYRDNEHLFVTYPDRVAFLDLADARLANFQNAAPSGRAEYDPERNTLYFLKEEILHAMVFPGS